MGNIIIAQALAASLALEPAMATAPPADVTPTVRTFLEAFATNPAATKALVTADAMIAVGDIGGPLSEFMKKVRPKATWFETCRVSSLQMKPSPSDAELNGEDTPPWLKGGEIAVVEGLYSCTGPQGTQADVRVHVVLKDGRVAQFAMSPRQ
jgi:hypothetical protein